MAVEPLQTSEDAVLGGRLVLRQPLKGHRRRPRRHSARGCVFGASRRSPGRSRRGRWRGRTGRRATGRGRRRHHGRDRPGAGGARTRERHAATDSPSVRARVPRRRSYVSSLRAAELAPGGADHVLMNPPFNAAQNPSPDRGRRLAHAAADDTLECGWGGGATPSTRGHADVDLARGRSQ